MHVTAEKYQILEKMLINMHHVKIGLNRITTDRRTYVRIKSHAHVLRKR
jgi:hypothetical protein